MVIIWTPLNTSGWNHELESNTDWLDKRISILNKYTIPSLSNQSDKDFLYFIEVREDTIDYIKPRLNIGEINVKFISREKCNNWGTPEHTTWSRSIESIKQYVNTDIFFDVRLNSDDAYHYKFISTLKSIKLKKDTEVIIPRVGYYWYMKDNVVVKRKHKSPPFYALIYNTKKYLNGFKYFLPGGHLSVSTLKHISINNPMWCWLVHDSNQKVIRKGSYPDYNKFERVNNSVLKDFFRLNI